MNRPSKDLNQPTVVYTGKFTGRSPQDRYIVKTNKNKIEWGVRNKSISEKVFEKLYGKIKNIYLKN